MNFIITYYLLFVISPYFVVVGNAEDTKNESTVSYPCTKHYSINDGIWSVENGKLTRNFSRPIHYDCPERLEFNYEIVLDATGIDSFAENVFMGFNHVTTIQLQNNLIQNLDGSPFVGMDSLKILNLGYGFDKTGKGNRIGNNAFDGLPQLSYLRIDHNYLSYLHTDVINGLSNLEFLDLGRNEYTYFERDLFKSLTKLTSLGISKNKLTHLDPHMIFDFPSGLLNFEVKEMENMPCCAVHMPNTLNSIQKEKCYIPMNHPNYIFEGAPVANFHIFYCMIGETFVSQVAGDFSNQTIQQICGSCPNGYLSSISTCNPCPPGFECKNGVKSHRGLPSEYYNTESNQYVICPKGSYCVNGEKVECPPGFHGNETGLIGECQSCDPGEYSDLPGSPNCKQCTPGTYSNKTLHASNFESTCLKCPEGSYTNTSGNFVCTDCPSGTFRAEKGGNSIDQCMPCPPGTFSPSSGSSQCLLCDVSYYQNEYGASSCVVCPENQYTDSNGASSCKVKLSTETIAIISCVVILVVFILLGIITFIVKRVVKKEQIRKQEERLYGMTAEDFVKQGRAHMAEEMQTDEQYMENKTSVCSFQKDSLNEKSSTIEEEYCSTPPIFAEHLTYEDYGVPVTCRVKVNGNLSCEF